MAVSAALTDTKIPRIVVTESDTKITREEGEREGGGGVVGGWVPVGVTFSMIDRTVFISFSFFIFHFSFFIFHFSFFIFHFSFFIFHFSFFIFIFIFIYFDLFIYLFILLFIHLILFKPLPFLPFTSQQMVVDPTNEEEGLSVASISIVRLEQVKIDKKRKGGEGGGKVGMVSVSGEKGVGGEELVECMRLSGVVSGGLMEKFFG